MKKLSRVEIKLLQAETEITLLKDLLFKLRTKGSLTPIDGDEFRTAIELRDLDYNTITVHPYKHNPKKQVKSGCMCWRCKEIRNNAKILQL